MEDNLHCYTFEEHIYRAGLLDQSVDATYVIHLRNNGRYELILKEINEYKPTSLVYIMLNEGYKKCQKVFPQKGSPSSAYDIVDASLQIYKHANQMNYKNILILEDDCFFSPDIRDKKVLTDLNVFLSDNTSQSFTYRVGSFPILLNPLLTHASYGFYLGLHAYVISAPARALVPHQATILDMDEFINFFTTQYTYYKPLAYQLYPETENQKHWGYNVTMLPRCISQYIPQVSFYIIKAMNLDKSKDPGYAIMYTISKILYSLLLLLVVFILYKCALWIPVLLNSSKTRSGRLKSRLKF